MNILFITPSEVQPLNGGIERITSSLARVLQEEYAYSCRFMNLVSGCSKEQLKDEIKQQHIDIIIAQGADKRIANLLPTLREIVDGLERKVSLLFVFHSNPGVELAPMDYGALWNRIIHGIDRSASLKQLGWQLMKPFVEKRMIAHLKKKYRVPYDCADRIILLSKRFIPEYQFFSGGDTRHFLAIPNMLSFDSGMNLGEAKTKTVLLVSRMEERQKRIKLALKIWNKVQHNGWQLKIVGAGEDLDYYKRLAKKWDVQNVSFEGRQNPLPYYQESPIFMMTSAFEGWGLTLTEAQQCGCVPIVFDTYASLPDIVTNGRNGIIVKEEDIEQYVTELQNLMDNPNLLQDLARNAQEDCKRYTPQKVAEKWHGLFTELAK